MVLNMACIWSAEKLANHSLLQERVQKATSLYSACFFKLVQKNTNCWKDISHSIFQIIFLKKRKYSFSYLFNYIESVHTTQPFGWIFSLLQLSAHSHFFVFLPRTINVQLWTQEFQALPTAFFMLPPAWRLPSRSCWPIAEHARKTHWRGYVFLATKTTGGSLYYKLILKEK